MQQMNRYIHVKKLKRNRDAAKNSRKRKKLYLELLEKKCATLESELVETKQKHNERSAATAPAIPSRF